MPEGLEAEIYRRAAVTVIGRQISRVVVDERQQFAAEIAAELPGRVVTAARRIGKLVMIDSEGPDHDPDDTVTLGVHFGMAGRLIVDDRAAIDELAYSSRRDNPDWDRLVLTFTPETGGGSLRVNDPRRWSRFTLNPRTDRLGPDLFDLGASELGQRLSRRQIPIKAALLDQSVVAGLGNMLIDELLFHAGIRPDRPANTLNADEVERLVGEAGRRLPAMLSEGGSHTGDIAPAIRAGGANCPRCDMPLQRTEVGGRTTIWCRDHQT